MRLKKSQASLIWFVFETKIKKLSLQCWECRYFRHQVRYLRLDQKFCGKMLEVLGETCVSLYSAVVCILKNLCLYLIGKEGQSCIEGWDFFPLNFSEQSQLREILLMFIHSAYLLHCIFTVNFGKIDCCLGYFLQVRPSTTTASLFPTQ